MAGTGVLGDFGSHTIGMARFLVRDIACVSGQLKTFVDERPVPGGDKTRPVTVDDAYSMQGGLENGAMRTFEASRIAAGNKNDHGIEIHGSKGSIRFSLKRLNELNLLDREGSMRDTRPFWSLRRTTPLWRPGGCPGT